MNDTVSIQSNDINWLQLINFRKLSAEEQRDLWNNRAFYRKNSAEVNALLVMVESKTRSKMANSNKGIDKLFG